MNRDRTRLKRFYLYSVGQIHLHVIRCQSDYSLAFPLISQIDRCHKICGPDTLKLASATSQEHIHAPWWIVAYIQFVRANEVELYSGPNCYWFIHSGYRQPQKQSDSQGQQLQEPVFNKYFVQPFFDRTGRARILSFGYFIDVLKGHWL